MQSTRRFHISSIQVVAQAVIVLVVTTGQGSEITLGLGNLDQELRRWQAVHEWGLKMNKVILTLDLAVANNVPARWLEASSLPPATPQNAKPQRPRKRNV